MCTVVFISKQDGGYLLGHNRDESTRRRKGQPPNESRRDGTLFISPRDPEGGGTWIGVNQFGLSLCVLNAVQAASIQRPTNPKSRGMIAWDLLHLSSADAIERHLNHFVDLLQSVRAFQLVVAEPEREGKAGHDGDAPFVHRFSWDGAGLRREKSPGPAIFVSSGYDQPGAEKARSEQWRRFLESNPDPDAATLSAFLSTHEPNPSELSICMHRKRAHSVSRTLVQVDRESALLTYHDGRPCDSEAEDFTSRLALARSEGQTGKCS
jgi:hypothetical protein